MRTLLLGLALGLAAPSHASSFYPLDLASLVSDTTDVVQVRVVRTTSEWSEDGQALWTFAELKVIGSFAGGFSAGDVIVVREIGGTVDGYTVSAIGFPSFRAGDELVVFLGRWDDGALRVSAGPQGFYRVERKSGAEPVLVPGPTQDRPDEARGEIPGPLANVKLSRVPSLVTQR